MVYNDHDYPFPRFEPVSHLPQILQAIQGPSVYFQQQVVDLYTGSGKRA
jgi:hypothetical protein